MDEIPLSPLVVAFVAWAKGKQLACIGTLTSGEALTLANGYLEAGGEDLDVLARLLERAEPAEYLESEQDPLLRQSLEPEALAQVRDDTYKITLRPLLVAEPAKQQQFLESLAAPELDALLVILDRYARQYGRSSRVRQLESCVREWTNTRR